MQRWVSLRRGLVDCDSVCLRCGHILPDRQHQLDQLSSGRILPYTRAGHVHAESGWKLLQQHGPLGLRPLHGRFILLHYRAERTDGQLQRRLPLSDRLEFDGASSLPADDILPLCQFRGHRVPRVVVLRQHGHERRGAVHKGILLLCRRTVGAKRCVRSGSLLRDGLEHGETVPVHEWHLLPARQL